MLRRARGFIRGDRGAVAPLVAIALIGLIGMGALAWDVSRAFAFRGELDAATDAAALAGATQLDGGSTAITRATAAARNALVTNSQALSRTPGAVTFGSSDATIAFLSSLSPRTYTTTPADADFIEITMNPKQVGLVAGALLRFSQFNVRAHATAGYGAALCLVPPIMICNPNENTSPIFNGDDYTGKAFVLTPPPGGNTVWGPGNFGFLDVGDGANAVKDAMGRFPPQSQCFGSQVLTEPGNIESADDWYNTRFDIYRGSAGGNKNDPEFAPALNTIIGAMATSGSSSCTPTVPTPSHDCSNADAVSTGFGLPIDCNMTSTAVTVGDGVWNVGKYFATNHGGSGAPNPTTYAPEVPASPAYTGSGWNAYGPPPVAGATSPTRFQVYNWEVAMLADTIATPSWAFSNPTSNQDPPSSGSKDFARPTCNRSNLTQPSPDRRKISAVVVNCRADNIKGKTTANVVAYVDFFSIAPAASSVIYGEFVGQTIAGGPALGTPTKRFWVRLYE